MTEKRFTVGKELRVVDDNILKGIFYVCIDRAEALKLADELNEFHNENIRLVKENEQLKQTNQELYDKLQETMSYKALKMGEVSILEKENKQLKQQVAEVKKDEEQLSISFMEYKMQLIDVLQQNYNYAYSQRQKNLDKTIVARSYELLYQTIGIIAETMNVDIEIFPKR